MRITVQQFRVRAATRAELLSPPGLSSQVDVMRWDLVDVSKFSLVHPRKPAPGRLPLSYVPRYHTVVGNE